MHIVCDTNILISGLLWRGPPANVLQRIEDHLDQLFLSRELLSEFAAVMDRPKFAAVLKRAGLTADEPVRWVIDRGILVIPKPLPGIVVHDDPADDHVLACAATVRADCMISGDRHLLDLGSYAGIPILTSEAFLRRAQE